MRDDEGQAHFKGPLRRSKTTGRSGALPLIRYAYPLLEELFDARDYRLLGIPDIAAMKLSAATHRGSKKDFFDLAILLRDYSLSQLLEFYGRKFRNHDVFFVVKILSYFEDAENEPDPLMLSPVSWDDVKLEI